MTNPLTKHKAAYYAGNPIITDEEYDALVEETGGETTVGAPPRGATVRHLFPMLSLNKVIDTGGLYAWMNAENRTGHKFRVETKIDGVAISARYNQGKLIHVATRGDGEIGKDVTRHLQGCVPPAIAYRSMVEVRGEVFMSIPDFIQYRDAEIASGRPEPANPRNVVCGALNKTQTTELKLAYIMYDVVGIPGLATYEGTENWLEHNGFNPHKAFMVGDAGALKNSIMFVSPPVTPYPTDGLVIKMDDRIVGEKLGATATAPRWAVAFKFPGGSAMATVTGVMWQVGRTGVITPVMTFSPVVIGGSVITRATLHNYANWRQLKPAINDIVTVVKCGDIIPGIIHIQHVSPAGEGGIMPPQICPECGEGVCTEGQDLVCENPACPGVVSGQVQHFCDAIQIKGYGPRTVRQMIKDRGVRTISYFLSIHHDIVTAAGKEELWRVIWALGIVGVGKEKAKELAKKYISLADYRATVGKCEIADFLLSEGVNPVSSVVSGTPTKYICITGTFDSPRSEIERYITACGGQVVSAVTSKTTRLLVGDKPGSKLIAAKKAGVPCLSLDELKTYLTGA